MTADADLRKYDRTRAELGYINRTYGLRLTKGCPVVQPSTGRRGVVAGEHAGKRHYIDIKWDGNKFASGPFHPTHDLVYPAVPEASHA